MIDIDSSQSGKPLVTFVVFSYNQAEFIGDAILGALNQDYSPLQIIVSDDCSMDDTFLIAERLIKEYRGKHQVSLLRNETNLGLIAHVNKIFGLCKGDLIVVSAGDDISSSCRTRRAAEEYLRRGRPILLLHSDVEKIDQLGREKGGWAPPVASRNYSLMDIATSEGVYIGATAVFSRSLVDRFPPVEFENAWEDLVWGFRAAMLDALIYLPEPLVKYRIGVGVSAEVRDQKFFSAMLKTHRKMRSVIVDVLEQRLRDVGVVNADCSSKLKLALRKALKVERVRHQISVKPVRGALVNLLLDPIAFCRALFMDLRWIVNYCQRKIKNAD
jgi:glycosyltransferase involved in cell wall biosynthesis